MYGKNYVVLMLFCPYINMNKDTFDMTKVCGGTDGCIYYISVIIGFKNGDLIKQIGKSYKSLMQHKPSNIEKIELAKEI